MYTTLFWGTRRYRSQVTDTTWRYVSSPDVKFHVGKMRQAEPSGDEPKRAEPSRAKPSAAADQKNALELMHGPIENELMRLACRELPPGINCEERQSHSSKAREASFNRKGKCKHGGVAPWLRCRPCQAAGIVGSGSLLS